MTIGIVDTGLDTSNTEFAGRISPASADVAGTRGIDPQDDHGTLVALVAAASRNNSGIVGIAYEATVLALRADTPGSCNTDCSFNDNAIAAGVNRAVANGARVINLSLGGSSPSATLRSAITTAANAGVVVIVSAGNDANEPNPSTDPNNPDPFAVGVRGAGNGNVIIAGSVNSSGVISDFSNRAGAQANWYLNALGEQICCVYEGSSIKVTTQGNQQFVTVVSGTSFSAPQIAGAAALLFQAFPNLTATQVVDLLLRTARDAGASGTDAVYGRGILDITNAFAPQGTTTLAGGTTSTQVTLSPDSGIVTSAAMGDALRTASLETIVLDSYNRAYQVDLAGGARSASPSLRLTGALTSRLREVATGTDKLSLAFAVDRDGLAGLPAVGQLRLSQEQAEGARVLATRVVARLTPKTTLGFAFAEGANGLVAQLRGSDQPAFLIATSPLDDVGFSRRDQSGFALRHRLGPWGLTVMGETGQARSPAFDALPVVARLSGNRTGTEQIGATLDRRFGAFDTSVGLTWLGEERSILGARLRDGLGEGGADTLSVDASLGWQPNAAWRFGAAWRQGYTRARANGILASGSGFASNAWAVDATRFAVLNPRDSVSFRLSQPLRVSSGGLSFNLPVDYSYDTLSATSGVRTLSLTPHGRELTGELAWRGPLGPGWGIASAYYRRNPGHFAELPDDKGVALRWSLEF